MNESCHTHELSAAPGLFGVPAKPPAGGGGGFGGGGGGAALVAGGGGGGTFGTPSGAAKNAATANPLGVLQCVAVRCSVLQCVAVCCGVFLLML